MQRKHNLNKDGKKLTNNQEVTSHVSLEHTVSKSYKKIIKHPISFYDQKKSLTKYNGEIDMKIHLKIECMEE